jgi:O-antigen/teichoic acid export membrane protein
VSSKCSEVTATLHTLISLVRYRLTNLNTFAGQVSLTMVTNVIIAALGMATGLLSARLLGPTGRGELAAIQTWSILVASLALLGLPEAVVYFTSRHSDLAGRYLVSSVAFILMGSSGFIILGWGLMPWLLRAQSREVIDAARVFLVVMLLAFCLIGMPHQVLRAVGAWRAWNLFRILPHLGWLTGLLGVLVFSSWATPVALSRLYLGAHMVLIFPMAFLIWRYIQRPFEMQTGLFRPFLNYGLPSMLTILPQAMNLRLDQLLIAMLFEPRLLGLYVVAAAWSGAIAPIINAVGPVLFPQLSKVADPTQQRILVSSVVRVTSLVILILTVLLLVLTPFMVPFLFGSAYRDAVPAAQILVVAGAFGNLNLTLEDGLRGLGRPRQVLTAEVIGMVVTAVLLWLLLPLLNILGAALASVVAYAAITLCLVYAIRRELIMI